MDIKVLNKTNNEVTFVIDGINSAIANTIRRLISSEVCTLAIEDIHVNKNSSALYDEMLAHRIGLIPLKTDLKSYNTMENCKCKGKGCAHCQLLLTLKTKDEGTVYASALQSKDPKVVPVYPNMLIVKLMKGHELDLECTAILSNGKNHAKFSPGLVYYHGYPKDGKDVSKLIGGKLEGKGSDTKFVFYIEPWGQLEAREMLTEAIKIMDEKLDEFEKQIKKIK